MMPAASSSARPVKPAASSCALLSAVPTIPKMKKIENCLHCNQCKSKCPYGLDTPKLLEENYKDYVEILNGKEF